MATLLENYKGKSDGSVLTAVEWNNCMSAIENGIEAAKSGADSDSTGILYTDDGSTVLQSTSKNTNLVAYKNIQIKSKNGKLIYDTTSTIANGGDNEIQVIAKVKDTVESTGYEKDDHADEIHEIRRFRIKPYDTPRPTDRTQKTEGFLALDTSGLEDTRGTSEEDFEIRSYTTNVPDSEITLSKTQYRNLVTKSRGIELRQVEAGGIALQSCGFDNHSDQVFDSGHHYENKIKFESSRVKPITEGLYEDGSISDREAYVKDGKWIKGGKGMEYATFNNVHTSIFTKDYRFNQDGIIRAVTRGDLVESPTSGKVDYPTQNDDFKDIISEDPHNNATVKSITKTAYSFNGGKNRHTKITSGGNLELQTNVTYHWVLTTQPEGEGAEIQTLAGNEASCSIIGAIYNSEDFKDANVSYNIGVTYKIGEGYYKLEEIESPEITIKSDADVTLKSDDDVILNAKDCVKLEAPEIILTGTNLVSFSTTPKIVALSKKFTKSAKLESNNTQLVIGILNNTPKTSWYNKNTGKMTIICDILYINSEEQYIPITATNQVNENTALFVDQQGTPAELDTTYFIIIDGAAHSIKTKNKSAVIGKNGAVLCTESDYPNTIFKPNDYQPTIEDGQEIKPESIAEGDSCNLSEIITLVKYMKITKPEIFGT